jgi:cell division protein FtsI (penicillin-binding protein 3)
MMAVGALANGGLPVTPTFLKRSVGAGAAPRVKPETSEAMRYLMRLNAEINRKIPISRAISSAARPAPRQNVHGHYSGTGFPHDVHGGSSGRCPKYLFLDSFGRAARTAETAGYRTAA